MGLFLRAQRMLVFFDVVVQVVLNIEGGYDALNDLSVSFQLVAVDSVFLLRLKEALVGEMPVVGLTLLEKIRRIGQKICLGKQRPKSVYAHG